MTVTIKPDLDLTRAWFDELVSRLQVYGLDRLTAMNAANEARVVHEHAFSAGVAAGAGTEQVLRMVSRLVEEHSARRRGDSTYDTARAVLLDFQADLIKAAS